MQDDVYFRLGEQLNQHQVKILLIEPYMRILREFYTPEQAELGAQLPVGALTAAELADTLNRDLEPLTAMLETMADNGLVFVTRGEDGVSKYALTQFVPGVVEFQLMRGRDTPKDRKVAKMLKEFFEGEMRDLMQELFKNPEMVKQMLPDAPARIITVEHELPQDIEVYSYEKLSEMLEKEESFAAAKCYCRHHAHLVDDPCKIEGIPEYSCLMFGDTAEYIIDRRFGKRITKEEAQEIILATEKAGLMHNTGNYCDRAVFVCNCCGCCCEFLGAVKRTNSTAMLAHANFVVAIDADRCSGCGDCIERCQMEALSLVNEVISVNENMCLGCGNCVSACPTESLSMVRRANVKPPEAKDTLHRLGMG
jgi:NAD-dependent dihydropyrimidine dehydrogenase PreA subunit